MRTIWKNGTTSSGLALRQDYYLALPRAVPAPDVVRLSGLALAAALISTLVVGGTPLQPSPASASVPERGSVAIVGKDQARVPGSWGSVAAVSKLEPVREERPAFVLPGEPAQGGGWHEKEFPQVTVLDGRTLDAGAFKIKLAGIDLPGADAMCTTLDGRLEACATRAATQLELNTRWRRVVCHYQVQEPGEAVGNCRVGTADLAEKVVRAGYARRVGATVTPL